MAESKQINPLIIPIASAALSAGANLFSAAKGNQARKDEATTKYNRDTEAWHRQNAYNDPSAQMARLKAAGLNPNMIYGTGTAAATGQASLQAAAAQPQIQNLPTPNTMDMLQTYQSIQTQKSQRSLQQSAVEKNISQTAINMTRNSILGDEAQASGQFYTNRAYHMYNQQRISNQQRVMAEKRLQNIGEIFNIEMKDKRNKAAYQATVTGWIKDGIVPSDTQISRITYSIMREKGEDPRNTMLAAAIAKEVALLATGLGIGKLIGAGKGKPSPSGVRPKNIRKTNVTNTRRFNSKGELIYRTKTSNVKY